MGKLECNNIFNCYFYYVIKFYIFILIITKTEREFIYWAVSLRTGLARYLFSMRWNSRFRTDGRTRIVTIRAGDVITLAGDEITLTGDDRILNGDLITLVGDVVICDADTKRLWPT